MKTPTLLAVGALAGATTGALAGFLVGRTTPAPVAAHAAPAAAADDLAARLEALDRENQALSGRLLHLEQLPPPSLERAPVTGFVTREELAALREELAGTAPGSGPSPAPDPGPGQEPAVFQERVAYALKSIRKQEQFDALRERTEKRMARIDQDMRELEQRLALSPYQSKGMRTALVEQYEREEALRLRWEAGEAPEVLGEIKAAAIETFRGDVGAVLGPDQAESFWALTGRK